MMMSFLRSYVGVHEVSGRPWHTPLDRKYETDELI
jgi:hypothetical protein